MQSPQSKEVRPLNQLLLPFVLVLLFGLRFLVLDVFILLHSSFYRVLFLHLILLTHVSLRPPMCPPSAGDRIADTGVAPSPVVQSFLAFPFFGLVRCFTEWCSAVWSGILWPALA